MTGIVDVKCILIGREKEKLVAAGFTFVYQNVY
jgi:hypothetical protein